MYVKITDGSVDQYPYTIEQMRRDNSNTSFPKTISDEILAEYGVFPVQATDGPEYDFRSQTCTQNTNPTLESGVWKLGWTVSSKSSSEISEFDTMMASTNRAKRDALLAETDYLALSDNTMSAEMQSYRQSLRDITTHSNWPNLQNTDWPSKP